MISTALPEETSVSFITETKSRPIMPTDVQALTVLQDLLSDDLQVKEFQFSSKKGRR